jgi:hypothetical protein
VTAILGDILRMTVAIERLLASVASEKPEGRRLLVEQWQERLNLSWPPQRRRDFICTRLLAVAGWKVNPRKIADRWLEPLAEYLSGLRSIPDSEREVALTGWLDAQLKADPDSRPIVGGDDLIDLGVPPTLRKGLLEELQRGQLRGLSRDELLQTAINAVQSTSDRSGGSP